MDTKTTSSGVAGASVPVPSAGEALRFAAYVAELIGDDRVGHVSWHTDKPKLFVEVTETIHGETVAHLLGLEPRTDLVRDDGRGFSCWEGKSGLVPVFLSAPLALGSTPERRPWDWSAATDAVKAVA
jgi:hypothetical protein